jgi:hypothetical protein
VIVAYRFLGNHDVWIVRPQANLITIQHRLVQQETNQLFIRTCNPAPVVEPVAEPVAAPVTAMVSAPAAAPVRSNTPTNQTVPANLFWQR